MAPPTEQLNINDPDAAVQKHPFFGSVRMTYVICGFVGMLLHHCLRSATNISILCMVAESPAPTTFSEPVNHCEMNVTKNDNHKERKGDLSWNRDQEILFPSVFFYGYIIALPIAGYLSDKYGGKALFISSIMLEGAVFLLIPICARWNFWMAVAMRVTQGLIAGLGNPALYSLFAVWAHPTERSASIACGFAGFHVGNLVTLPLVGFLCEYGWDNIFYILGGTVFAAGFVMNWLVYNNVDEHPRISPEEYRYLKPSQATYGKKIKTPWKSILTCVPVYAFIFTHFFHCFGTAMLASMIPRYFKEALSLSVKQASFLTSALFGGSSASIIIVIILTSQIEKRPTANLDLFHRLLQLVCCWGTIPFILVLLFLNCESYWDAFGIWFVVFCLSDIAFSGGYFPTLSFLAPSYSGLLIGIANCIGQITSVLVPIAVTQIVPTGSSKEWDHAIAMLIVTYFIDGLNFAVFGSSKLQPWGLVKDDQDVKS